MIISVMFVLKFNGRERCARHALYTDKGEKRTKFFLISSFRRVLNAFIWAIPGRLNFVFQRFGTLCLFYLHRQVGMKNSSYLPAYEDGTDRMFRNVGT